MRVRVLFFAGLAQQVGQREAVCELPAGCSVEAALQVIASQHPAVAMLRQKLACAVNCEYVSPEHTLVEDDELALIPPVSGG